MDIIFRREQCVNHVERWATWMQIGEHEELISEYLRNHTWNKFSPFDFKWATVKPDELESMREQAREWRHGIMRYKLWLLAQLTNMDLARFIGSAWEHPVGYEIICDVFVDKYI